MSTLLAVEDVIDVLGGLDAWDEDDTPVLDRLITLVEALFLSQVNRRHRPYQAAQTARAEVHNGTGDATLFLDYPIAALSSVKIGANPSSPDETLAVGDLAVLRYAVGGVELRRVDGGCFGTDGDPRVVHVLYNAAADLPDDVVLAVQNVVVTIWRRRGSEDVTSDRVGGFQGEYLAIAAADPLWTLAVAANRVPALV